MHIIMLGYHKKFKIVQIQGNIISFIYTFRGKNHKFEKPTSPLEIFLLQVLQVAREV